MNKKTIYIIVAVLVIIIVVGVAAYALLYNSGGGGTTTPTPTPTTNGVGDATTLTFSANVTSQGQTTTYNWSGRDIHSSNLTIRTDFATYSYLLDATTEKSWSSTDSGATWTAGNFTDDWPFWDNQWSADVDALVGHWDGTSATYSYTNAQGEAIVLFNIVVNPTIPDSTFTAS